MCRTAHNRGPQTVCEDYAGMHRYRNLQNNLSLSTFLIFNVIFSAGIIFLAFQNMVFLLKVNVRGFFLHDTMYKIYTTYILASAVLVLLFLVLF